MTATTTETPRAHETVPAERSEQPSESLPGQGFRALTERWTRERVEQIVVLLHRGDRAALEKYLADEVPTVTHATDPPGSLDLKGLHFKSLPYRVDLGRVSFEGLNLWSSRFEDVSLNGARFKGCALGLSSFVDAYLRGVEVVDCDMHGCTFTRSILQKMRFKRTDLKYSSWTGCAIDIAAFPEELEEERKGAFAAARDVYKALRLDLNAAGDTAGASWAAYRQQQLARRELKASGRRMRYLLSLTLDALWGYGERPLRLLAFSLVFCVIWALLYFVSGLHVNGQCVAVWTVQDKLGHLFQCLYFSFVTFTTLGYGDLSPCTVPGRTLAMIQAFAGVFIMGLFVSANVRKLMGG